MFDYFYYLNLDIVKKAEGPSQQLIKIRRLFVNCLGKICFPYSTKIGKEVEN